MVLLCVSARPVLNKIDALELRSTDRIRHAGLVDPAWQRHREILVSLEVGQVIAHGLPPRDKNRPLHVRPCFMRMLEFPHSGTQERGAQRGQAVRLVMREQGRLTLLSYE